MHSLFSGGLIKLWNLYENLWQNMVNTIYRVANLMFFWQLQTKVKWNKKKASKYSMQNFVRKKKFKKLMKLICFWNNESSSFSLKLYLFINIFTDSSVLSVHRLYTWLIAIDSITLGKYEKLSLNYLSCKSLFSFSVYFLSGIVKCFLYLLLRSKIILGYHL